MSTACSPGPIACSSSRQPGAPRRARPSPSCGLAWINYPRAKPSSSGFEPMPSACLRARRCSRSKGSRTTPEPSAAPLIATMPSSALRQEFRASLDFELETATTLGLDHIGLPISSESIASLFGVAKQHGVGQTQDAARIALRLPALCGAPTREEAQQVL